MILKSCKWKIKKNLKEKIKPNDLEIIQNENEKSLT
jgi:hypothetical protein